LKWVTGIWRQAAAEHWYRKDAKDLYNTMQANSGILLILENSLQPVRRPTSIRRRKIMRE
jgi:hypothetical protein